MVRKRSPLYDGGADEPVVEREEWLLPRYADETPTRIGARDLDCRAGDAGAMLRKLHHLRRRDQARDQLRRLQLDERCPRQAHTVGDLLVGRLVDAVVGVTQRHRPQTHAVVQIALALGRPDISALTT